MVGTFRLPSGTTTAPPAGPTATPWVRPADWLAMPTPGAQEVIGLLAIYEDANYIAVQCQGPYTVDWGDGTVTNYNINVNASKTYDFSSIPAGTTTSEGFRQVIVRITPQAGQNLTSVAFAVQNTTYAKNGYSTGWLDIEVKMPNGTPFFNGHTNIVRYHRLQRLVITDIALGSLMGNLCNSMLALRSFSIGPTKTATTTNFVSMFGNCLSIEEVPLFDTSSGTGFNSMFSGCTNLRVVPQYNFQNATSFDSTFYLCRSLTTVPLFNIGNATKVMSNMFNECTSLTSIPLINTTGTTNMANMFTACRSLTTIPLLNLSSCTNTNSMFSTCQSLSSIPLLDTSKVVNMSNMFVTCQALRTIPLLDTSKNLTFNSFFSTCTALETIPLINTELGTDFNSMFTGCPALQEVPLLNTGSASTFNAMFNGCNSLQAVPAFNTAKVATFNNAFNNCLGLRELPALNMSAGTSFTTFIGGNVSIGKSTAFGARFAHSYTNMALVQAEIVNIFTNLGTASGAQAITVSSNPGYAGLTTGERAIATGKGWTIA
jgi:hypothetical protein